MRWIAGAFTVAAMALVTASAVPDPRQQASADGRLAFEVATIKLAAPDAVRNQVIPTRPNRLYIPSMTLTALIYAAYGDGGFNTSMRVTGRSGLDQQDGLCRRRCRAGTSDAAATAAHAADPPRGALCVENPQPDQTAECRSTTCWRWWWTEATGASVQRSKSGTAPVPRSCRCCISRRLVDPCRGSDDKFVVGPASEADDRWRAVLSHRLWSGWDTSRWCHDVHGRRAPLAAAGAGVAGHHHAGSHRPDRPLHDGAGLPVCPAAGPAAPAAPPEFAGPSLSTAVQEQWGLRLVPSKGPLKVIVVESAQPPTGN